MPVMAYAAPFCMTLQGIPPQCIYDDARDCKHRAGQLSGICTVNINEITSATGAEKFCSVDSTRTPQCLYVDRNGCENSLSNGSICVNNTFKKMGEVQADPYADQPNRNF